MAAKGKKLGEVKSPSGHPYEYYWNESSGEVHVANESAGYAVSKEDAWRKANFYATTGQKMR
jgi:hypothetical protein